MKVYFTKKIEEGFDPNSLEAIRKLKIDNIDYCCVEMERIFNGTSEYIDLQNCMYCDYNGIMFVKSIAEHNYPVINIRSNNRSIDPYIIAEMKWCPFCGEKVEYELVNVIVLKRIMHKETREYAEWVVCGLLQHGCCNT